MQLLKQILLRIFVANLLTIFCKLDHRIVVNNFWVVMKQSSSKKQKSTYQTPLQKNSCLRLPQMSIQHIKDELNEQHLNTDQKFDHQMSLSKAQFWCFNNCLIFSKCAVPMIEIVFFVFLTKLFYCSGKNTFSNEMVQLSKSCRVGSSSSF